MTKRVTFEGRVYEFPDDATDEEISAALGREEQEPPQRRQMGVGEDVARSTVTGTQEGLAAVPGAIGNLQELNDEIGGVGLYWVRRAEGMSDAEARASVQAQIDYNRQSRRNLGIQAPTTRSVNDAILELQPEEMREWTAHEPQTVAGEYARTTAQFGSGSLFPGNTATRIARVVVPGVASEAGGQLAREYSPENETAARIVGGMTGGVATEVAVNSARNAPQMPQQRRAAPTGPLPDPDEFLPRTRGERTGNVTAIQRENELRRTRATDAGGDATRVPEQAQRTLRDFDDARAEVLQENMMRRLATRGRDPATENAGDAGIVVADDLRSGLESMEVEQAARYARARELAGQQAVAPTDELAANVGRVVEEQFLDAGPSVAVINRLDAQIRAGNATYETVETARQALNRQLGTAMRAGDDAQSYAIRRIIDELDAFVEPRLTGEAQAAVREARGYTREMMSLYGEQARPELSTGHTGRRDPGGRVIRQIIESEMTGDQVIDSIFGANGQRPSRAALGVVRRIHDRATQTIATGGYEAPTAQAGQQARAPGRTSMRRGRGTRGGRQFQGPSEAQQRAYGLPANEPITDPSLQALREAFIHRIGRRLRERSQGDAIPARQMANDLRAALDGPGSEITPLLFNAEEIALMRRALADLESVAPPRGTYNPSAPGVAQAAAERSFAAISGRILGRLPVVGPAIGSAIEEGIVNARAIRDAREAVRQPTAPQAQPSRPPPPRTEPNAAVPLVGALSATGRPGTRGDINTSRPALENADGSYSTERTITIEADGKFYVIPTIVGGRQLSEDDAIAAWERGENDAVREPFNTLDEAEAYARFRSARISGARQAAGAERY